MKKEEKINTENTIGIPPKRISDFLDTDYKNYVFYILSNRCLPSVCDGLKDGARKIMHAAFNGELKTGKKKKLINLTGDTFNYSLYPHGDISLNGTIVTLSQQFKFNLNPLYIDSQNGSLRNPKATASPRYLYVQLSKYADLWKTDSELLSFVFDEGQWLEPKQYWPVIPMVLANSQEGIGVGYKFYNMSYNPIDLIDLEMKILKKEDITGFHLTPFIRGMRKSSWKINKDGKWVSSGEITVNAEKDTVEITDLPYFQTFDDFEHLLNTFEDKGEIKDWKNFSEGEKIRYVVKFPHLSLSARIRKDGKGSIPKMFKISKVVPDDLLWVLDENSKIRHFENANDLVVFFTKWRLSKYTLRKNKMTDVIKDELTENNLKILFIQDVISGKLKIRKRPMKDILGDMKKSDYPEKFIRIPLSSLCTDEIDNLKKENKDIADRLDYIMKTDTVTMFMDDLQTLKKRLSPDFK